MDQGDIQNELDVPSSQLSDQESDLQVSSSESNSCVESLKMSV